MTTEEKLKKSIDAQRKIAELGLRIIESDPWVPVRFFNDEFRLEFSYGAVKEVFRRTGITIGFDELTTMQLGSPELMFTLLFCGLQVHHSGLFSKVEDLENAISPRHKNYYVTVLSQALRAVEPDPEEMFRIMAEAQEDDSQPPLLPVGISSDSGHDVEILDAPSLI